MTFNDREKGFENKYAHDEKMDFAVEARSSKLFGLWVAEQLGIEGDDLKLAYAKEVVEANLEEPGFEDIFRKVNTDLDTKGVKIEDHTLRTQLDKCVVEARKQLSES